MPSKHITDYSLYRWRYHISYGLLALLASLLVIFATLYVPGGLSETEMATTITSSQVSVRSFNPDTIIDLPYALLQRASFELLGVTTLSVKLPSLILSVLSIIGIILLLRQWFHENVAAIAALVVITASQFIFASQDGTPTIMYIVIPTWLLFVALKVSRQTRTRNLWEIVLMATLAISIYTPLSIYIILALFSATVLHPHLRYIVGNLSRRKLIVAVVAGLIVLAPLIAALVMKPELGLILLGIPSTPPDILANGWKLLETYFGFTWSEAGDQFRPIYTLPLMLLMIIGLIQLITTRYTARNYIITSWIVLLTLIILVNPSKTTVTFVPVMLLIAGGIDVLLHRWYRLFPRNPYARVAGLLPITILVAGIAFTGIERYFYTYHYNPAVSTYFVNDLNLLDDELDTLDGEHVAVLVTNNELPFYRVVASYQDNITVIEPGNSLPTDQHAVATRGAFHERKLPSPAKIITNSQSTEADRLYLYNPAQK